MEVFSKLLKPSNGNGNDSQPKSPSTLICFSHLRWDFVYQRPQHLLSRFATKYTVCFIEEPYWDARKEPTITVTPKADNLWIVVPHLPAGINQQQQDKMLKDLLDKFLKNKSLDDLIFWYYTPMALSFSNHIKPAVVLYDCMDELSNFKNPPLGLKEYEEELFRKADVVFTGGHSLYEAKKHKHHNIFPFPSSIDKKHFEQARKIHLDLLEVYELLFVENNPAGVKAFLAEQGLIENNLRLPVVPLSESVHEKVKAFLMK